MRPLTLHPSALNDAEYSVYIACLRDLAEDDESDVKAGDTFYERMHVGVREARAWLRGRYATLAPGMIDSVSLFHERATHRSHDWEWLSADPPPILPEPCLHGRTHRRATLRCDEASLSCS